MDLPERESVMVMGIDYWLSHNHILEPRLARKLDVDHFGSPEKRWNEANRFSVGVPVRDFPFQRVCPECQRLWSIAELRRGIECPSCDKDDGHSPKTMPPRLIAACERGHIDDFPWKWWARCKCSRKDSQLLLKGEGIDNLCSDLVVECKNCGKVKDLAGALQSHSLTCKGKRPWLGDGEDCEERIRGLMRGASNVYFPIIESSISIPPFSEHVHILLKDHIEPARENWKEGTIKGYMEINAGLKLMMEREGLSKDDVLRAFREIYAEMGSKGIKEEEWDRLTHDVKYHPLNDFQTEKVQLEGELLKRWFDSIRRVTKLREVIALRGLTRIRPYDLEDDKSQPVRMEDPEDWERVLTNSPNMKPRIVESSQRNWLPGAEMYGEGIFFEFNPKTLSAWEESKRVKERSLAICRQDRPATREGVDTSLPRTLLAHSFAHQFIRQVSFACGYSMASLRERLYSFQDGDKSMYGVLIYTATSDSEGTLGGLVAQAKDTSTVMGHLKAMTARIRTCSQDPLCGVHDPETTGNAWGASCHSCSQLPETSCEGLQNKVLDRYSLKGNDDSEGYFDDS